MKGLHGVGDFVEEKEPRTNICHVFQGGKVEDRTLADAIMCYFETKDSSSVFSKHKLMEILDDTIATTDVKQVDCFPKAFLSFLRP